ncbi:MAG: hypothetical protein ACNA8W_26660, partial [Bradymonadaceae bacterium]
PGEGDFCELANCDWECEDEACVDACVAAANLEARDKLAVIDACFESCRMYEGLGEIFTCLEETCPDELDEWEDCFEEEHEEGDVTCSEYYTCFYECWEEYDTCEAACGEDDEACEDACDDASDACYAPCFDLTDQASDIAVDLFECQNMNCGNIEEREAMMTCDETECSDEHQACMADQ